MVCVLGVVDLFSGTGGFSHGFCRAVPCFETVAAIDILEIAAKTTQANHTDAIVINDDIRNVRPSFLENELKKKGETVDIIIGGPPCQGFSSIRPFRSNEKDDPRNSLFEQFALYVNYFQPEVFVFENVVGLATHNKGKTVKAIQACFEQIGYTVDWRILNAASFGVPQKRERFIMIGHHNKPISFPTPTHYFEGSTIGYKDSSRMLLGGPELPKALSVMDAIGDLPPVSSGCSAKQYIKKPQNDYQRARRANVDSELTLHTATNHSEKMLEIISYAGKNIECIPKHLISSGFSSSYSRLDADEPSVTITVNFVHPASNRCIHPTQNRALTPREGARLQSFDDDYLFCGSRTQIVKQIGNAVPPVLGEAIGRHVFDTYFCE